MKSLFAIAAFGAILALGSATIQVRQPLAQAQNAESSTAATITIQELQQQGQSWRSREKSPALSAMSLS
ncbi:MAG: hypothetical protein HC886_18145 [Leptolyngbyaceae cyanobacterium SM1_1_3]|nr:hypothetical protein [Leptolyngbyaceae cyanobacterium SM1_1_3]